MRFDDEAGRTQHGFDTGAIGDPPVGWVTGVTMLDEVQLWITGFVEGSGCSDLVVACRGRYLTTCALHALEEYVTAGGVHTQATENLWSLLKRGPNGTYVAAETMHLDRYLDEQMFRFNSRIGHNDGSRFFKALSQVVNRRLTYAESTGKGAGPQA